MTGKSKIFIGCGVVVLIPVLALIGSIVYVKSDKEYVEQHAAVTEEGKNFGKTTDQNGCINKGLLWMGDVRQPTLKQLALNGRFVNECLRASKPSPNFCKDVPKWITRRWVKEQCQMNGRDDRVCDVVFDEKRTYCAGL